MPPSPVITKGFLFLPDSYSFTVTTYNFNWVVRRTQDDFEWLRDALVELFPGYIVPPKPSVKKGGLGHKRFLEAVLVNDVFRGNGALRAFLKEENLSAAKEVKPSQMVQSQKRPEKAEEMCSVTGYITCDPEESSDHITWQHEYFYHDQAAKIKLAESLSTLKFHLKEGAESLKTSAKQLVIIDSLQNTMEGCLPFRSIYASLSSLVDLWADSNLHFGALLVRHLTGFFHEQIEELGSIRDLVPVRQQWLEAYKRKPTDERVKNMYGFFNAQSKSEVDRVLKYQCLCLSLNFTDLCASILSKLSEASSKWSEFESLLNTKR